MGELATIISSALFAFFYYYKRDFKNPSVLVLLVWSLIVFFSNFSFWGLSRPNDNAYILIITGLFGLSLGFIAIKDNKIIKIKLSKQGEKEPYLYELNTPFIATVYIITIVFLLYQSITVISMIRSGSSLAVIRYYFTDSEYNSLRSSNAMIVLQNYIATPTAYIASATLPLEWMTGNRNKLFSIGSIIIISLWVLTSGGRSIIFWFLLYSVYLYFFLGKKIYLSKRVKRLIRIFVFITIIVIVVTTISRKGNSGLLYQLYQYAVAPVSFMSYWLDRFKDSYAGFRGYGAASFYGFLYFIIFLLRIIGIPYPRLFITARDITYTLPQEVVLLGGIRMNAFVTMFYVFYVDGGLLGVLLGSFGFSLVTMELYKRARLYLDKKSILLYVMMLQRIVFSFVTFYFVMPVQAMGFVYSLFVYRRVNE